MTQHSKYIYVYYRELMGFVFCGLMDGPSKEYVEAQIRQMDPHATAIRVNDEMVPQYWTHESGISNIAVLFFYF